MSRAAIIAALVLTGLVPVAAQNDVIASLGTTLRAAEDSIFSTFATGIAALTGERSVFTAATPEQRAAMVRSVFDIARQFVGSPQFAKRYAAFRAAQTPISTGSARSGDEARQQQQEQMELAIRQALDAAKHLPPEARTELENNIADMRKQIAELNADPAHRAQIDALTLDAARQEEAELQEKLAAFANEYPADINTLVARRLRQFLVTCNDVDFAAELVTGKDKKQRFVDPAYERRSAEWKMCFRAGKPAVDAARAAANEWLKALDTQKF